MIIGIDIDDVIAATGEKLVEYVEKYGKTIDLNNPLTSKMEIMRGRLLTEEIKFFAKKYACEIAESVVVKKDASNVLEKLRNAGNKIYIITARSKEKMGDNINEITIEWLKSNNINYDKLFMNAFDKKEFCKNNKVDIMLDDSFEVCNDLIGTKTKPILFTTDVNKQINTDITRINTWIEFENLIS